MHHSDNRYRGVTSTSGPMSVGQRIAMAIAVVFALGAVVLFFIAPGLVFALGGGAVLIGLAGRSYAENRGAARVILPLVWLIAPVAGLVLLFGNGGFLFFGLIEALLAPFGGAAAGWQALALLPRIVDLPLLAEPLLLGAASGLVAGFLTHWRRWRIGERTTDSLVSSALSGDRWSLTVLSLQTFAVSVAAAYVAASLLAMLGVFDIANADPLAMASALSHSVGGGGGPPYGPHALSLILVLLIALAAIGGFGLVVGLCTGVPLGALIGLVTWHSLVHGASAQTARALFFADRQTRPAAGAWILRAALRGASEGALGAILAGAALGTLHFVHWI